MCECWPPLRKEMPNPSGRNQMLNWNKDIKGIVKFVYDVVITCKTNKSEKRFTVTWLQTRNLEPNISIRENDYKSTLSWNDKGNRPLGNSIGVLLGSQPLL